VGSFNRFEDSCKYWRQTMTKQIQEAYIAAATRTPVGKAPRGMFRNTPGRFAGVCV
jgi:hypothetical protein